jgi:hypothetical protein
MAGIDLSMEVTMKKVAWKGVPFGSFLIALGLSSESGGMHWLETRFGISPDSGDGSLEFAVVSAALVLGATVLAASIGGWVGARVRRIT